MAQIGAGRDQEQRGALFPLTPLLRETLERQVQRTEALQREKGVIIPWLFHRDGKQIKTFRRSWITACVNAGFGKRITDTKGRVIKAIANYIPHDFRRTAVRNLERAGVPRSAAMKMVGHKTQAIYQRYAIADESMLRDAGKKLERLHMDDQDRATGKVPAK
jgi:integrase